MGYKLHIQKFMIFLYATNDLPKKEIKKTIRLTIASKIHLGINLSKEVKDLWTKNYKMLMKVIKEDTNNGNVFYVTGWNN